MPSYGDNIPSTASTSTASPEQQGPPHDEQTQPAITSDSTPQQRRPPTVDFTGHRPEKRNDTPPETSVAYVGEHETNPAQQTADNDEEHVRQILAAAAAQGMQLDPALLHAEAEHGQTPSHAPSQSEKRAQLMREAEEMRAALRAKEREIDELG